MCFKADTVCFPASRSDTINPKGRAPPYQLDAATTQNRSEGMTPSSFQGVVTGVHPGDFLPSPDSLPLFMVLEGIRTDEGMEGGWCGRGER